MKEKKITEANNINDQISLKPRGIKKELVLYTLRIYL
jgi:hypothetical protein